MLLVARMVFSTDANVDFFVVCAVGTKHTCKLKGIDFKENVLDLVVKDVMLC